MLLRMGRARPLFCEVREVAVTRIKWGTALRISSTFSSSRASQTTRKQQHSPRSGDVQNQ